MMANGNSTYIQTCVNAEGYIFPMLLTFVTLPFHIMIIKILAVDFRFDLPRHAILFSLSLSDAIMVCTLFISSFVSRVITIKLQSTGCMVYRGFLLFFGCSTTVISSLSITALSLERYIACIHSFHLHQILTESRVRYASIVGVGL